MNTKGTVSVTNPHVWVVAAMFAVLIVLHYPQQLLSLSSPSIFSFLGLDRHAIERILFLLPICYADYFLGIRAGVVSLAVAAVIMLPRIFLVSDYMPDALLETVAVLSIGVLINLWFYSSKKERERRQQMLSKLEATDKQLESAYRATRRNEKRLSALNEISSIINKSLELEDILSVVVDKLKRVMGLDVILIFLLDKDRQELKLVTHREVSEEFIAGLKGLKVGEGFNGRVAQSGEPMVVEDASQDPRLTRDIVRREGIMSEVIVPLKAKGNVVGTLAGAMRKSRQFHDEEVELLNTICSQVGMGIENSQLYQREHLAAEQALASEKRYREIFEDAHDAIWIHDSNGNIIAVNKATEEMIGYSSQELLKMNVRDFLAEEGISLARQIRRKLFLGEPVEQPYEQCLISKDGTERILKLTTNIIREDGKLKGFQNIARDVTREKEIQDKLRATYQELRESHQQLKESQEQLIQAEKLTSLGQLAASIAHEVNNPLSGVLAYTQLLAKKIRSNNIQKDVSLQYLSKMEAELVRSTKLIRHLLDFARQSPPAFRPLNLNDVVNRSFELAAHSAELHHIQTVKELDPSLPNLMADFDQLHQVCTNLILNAIQAMPQGGKLTLRTLFDNGQIKMQVQDTGCGISPKNMRKLFTPFFTTKQEVKGVGLGLAISYGIIQRHNGKIEVQSEEGEGTTFTIYLPLHNMEPSENTAVTASNV